MYCYPPHPKPPRAIRILIYFRYKICTTESVLWSGSFAAMQSPPRPCCDFGIAHCRNQKIFVPRTASSPSRPSAVSIPQPRCKAACNEVKMRFREPKKVCLPEVVRNHLVGAGASVVVMASLILSPSSALADPPMPAAITEVISCSLLMQPWRSSSDRLFTYAKYWSISLCSNASVQIFQWHMSHNIGTAPYTYLKLHDAFDSFSSGKVCGYSAIQ